MTYAETTLKFKPINFSLAQLLLPLFVIYYSQVSLAQPTCQQLFTKTDNSVKDAKKKILVLEPTGWDANEFKMSGATQKYEIELPKQNIWENIKYLNYLKNVFFNLDAWVKKITPNFAKQKYDGIIGIQDYPASLVASALGEALNLKVPRVDVMISLHNKFLSRQIQKSVAPEAVPPFALVDLKQIDTKNPPLPYPFFLKPVKGLSSIKAQVIRNKDDFIKASRLSASEKLASHIFARPLDSLMKSRSNEAISSQLYIAEGLLQGVQVTVDGLSQNGKTQILGVVDSVMYEGTNSFESFQYPSRLPEGVQKRMSIIASKVMTASGFDHSLFNVEMFYDQKTDKISIIEINPRMAYQFADLYEKVDGINLYNLQSQLATGEVVNVPHRQGQYKVAASFVPRVLKGQSLVALPSNEVINQFKSKNQDVRVRVIAKEGLASLSLFQDVESQRIAFFNIGSQSYNEMRKRINNIYEEIGLVIK